MSDTRLAMPTKEQRRAEGLRRLRLFTGKLHPHDGYLCQHDSDLLSSLIKEAGNIGAPDRGIPANLRCAYDRLKRVVDGNVGFPECVEATHAFTRTAFECVGAMLAAGEGGAAPLDSSAAVATEEGEIRRMVTTARSEFYRWGTGSDTRRRPDQRFQVMRQDGDAWDEISAHKSSADADAAYLDAAWEAAMTAVVRSRLNPEGSA